jgi:septal ring factor EnvC (AmiA/AmiB activator)
MMEAADEEIKKSKKKIPVSNKEKPESAQDDVIIDKVNKPEELVRKATFWKVSALWFVVLAICVYIVMSFWWLDTKNSLAVSKVNFALLNNRLDRIQQDLVATKDDLMNTKTDLAGTQAKLLATRENLAGSQAELKQVRAKLSSTRDSLIANQLANQHILNLKDIWIKKLEQNIPKKRLEKLKAE